MTCKRSGCPPPIEAWAEFTTADGLRSAVRLDSVVQVIEDKNAVILVSSGCEDLRVRDPYERARALVFGPSDGREVEA